MTILWRQAREGIYECAKKLGGGCKSQDMANRIESSCLWGAGWLLWKGGTEEL